MRNRQSHTVKSRLIFPGLVVAFVFLQTKHSHHNLQTAWWTKSNKERKNQKKKTASRKRSGLRSLVTFLLESFHALTAADNTSSMQFNRFYTYQNRSLSPSYFGPGDVVKKCSTPEEIPVRVLRLWQWCLLTTAFSCDLLFFFNIFVITEERIRKIRQKRHLVGDKEGCSLNGGQCTKHCFEHKDEYRRPQIILVYKNPTLATVLCILY